MIGSDLGRLAVFAALPFVDSAAAIVALAAVAGIGNAFFRPAVLAGLPNLVADAELATGERAPPARRVDDDGGRARSSAARSSPPPGPHLAYWVNAVTFAFSAAARRADPAAAAPERAADRPRALERPGGGLLRRPSLAGAHVRARRLVDRDARERRRSTSRRSSSRRRSYGAGDFGFGLLWAGSGIGLVIGGLAAASLIERDLGAAYVRFLARLRGRRSACAAAAPNVWIGVARDGRSPASGTAARSSRTSRFVQRGAPDRVRGRAFTLLMSANYAVLGLAFVRRGPAHERLRRALDRTRSPRLTILVAAAVSRLASRAASSPSRRPAAPPHDAATSDDGRARRRRPRRRHARARPRDLARRERRPGRARARPPALPAHGTRPRVGFTGAPGRRQVEPDLRARRHVRARGRTAGVISVDPSSPFTQGALLGDRIRLSRPLPRPGRLHPLDGHARPRRRPRRGDAAGAARCSTPPARTSSSSRRSARARARSACSRSPTPSCSCCCRAPATRSRR